MASSSFSSPTFAPEPISPSAGRRERHKADIKNRLFRAAIELFGTRGYTATTVEDITSAADVAKGTFFNYFPTKEHLLTAFSELRLEIVRRALVEVEEQGSSLHDAMRRLLFALMKEPGSSRGMARCMLLAPLGNSPITAVVERNLTRARKLLTKIVALGQRRGEIRADRPAEELARLFQQSFFGAMYLWVLHPNLNLERSLDASFALYWAGVAVEPRAAREKKRAL